MSDEMFKKGVKRKWNEVKWSDVNVNVKWSEGFCGVSVEFIYTDV